MKLLKHSTYNLLGLGLPLAVAVFTIPILIKELGDARFGLLTLIWAVVSYFGLFDLGLGRALTQRLAMLFSEEAHADVGPLICTATGIILALGVIAGVLMAAVAPWGVGLINAVPDKQEAIQAVYAMALALPVIVLTSAFRGILEARHAFGVINLIRLPMGLFTFLAPLVVVLYGKSQLDSIAAVLAAGRIVACAAHAYYAWRELPNARVSWEWRSNLLKPLCISGGWLTVSNIISPLMSYMDRFVIGAIVSASAVAFYATPQELVTKLWILPGALTAVLFPTFATQTALHGEKTWKLFKEAIFGLFIIMLPVTVALALFSHTLLSLWVSPTFAEKSASLMQIFAAGMLVSCIAQIPFTVIQSAGKAKVTALIHCLEMPVFLLLLWWLTSSYGTLGAAGAWLLRVVFDMAFMLYASMRVLNQPLKLLVTKNVMCSAGLTFISFSGILLPQGAFRIFWMSAVTILVVILVIRFLKLKSVQSA